MEMLAAIYHLLEGCLANILRQLTRPGTELSKVEVDVDLESLFANDDLSAQKVADSASTDLPEIGKSRNRSRISPYRLKPPHQERLRESWLRASVCHSDVSQPLGQH